MNNIFDVLIAIAASLITIFFVLGAAKRVRELRNHEPKKFDVYKGSYQEQQEAIH